MPSSSTEPAALLAEAEAHWAARGAALHPGWPLARALVSAYCAGVDWADEAAVRALDGPCLCLANHQTYVESVVFAVAMPGPLGRPVVALAREAQRTHWTGQLGATWFEHPAFASMDLVSFFDRDDPAALAPAVAALAARASPGNPGRGRSLLVHVEGTRRRSARRGRVQFLSPLWPALALETGWPVVPVRFTGGLPREDEGRRHDFPVDLGRQRIRVGAPIPAQAFRGLGEGDSVHMCRDAVNALSDADEHPLPGLPGLADTTVRWQELTGTGEGPAKCLAALVHAPGPGRLPGQATPTGHHAAELAAAAARALLAGKPAARLVLPATAEGRWDARALRWLMGPRGPAVEVA